ncbi:sec-independent protein translocase protein TatB [Herbihabitans rhizosphaerae]|uniref:Sec-independent protein translocase protein TatB n=1 Tax=Herbihabitans rhizosphaerae TaxID=1872711 RepID=A0A4Q7L612_9PSEU|nr:Sec-independent protein translocase protein TatB [Herbihabitans rhizosphaerae]RZS44280.1 sec-independent protein translocase protein TatB [Herbihabitans rhizosphaerae]
MFDSIGWAEILVIVVAGLFILGPERLPSAAAWLGRNVRKVRQYATGAREQLRTELGPEYDELRKPLQDLQGLRNFDPKRAVSQHLLDDDWNKPGNGGYKANGYTDPAAPAPAAPTSDSPPLTKGEKPPFDPDAT